MTTNETKRVSDREFDIAYNDMLNTFTELTGLERHNGIEFYFSEDRTDTTADYWKRRKTMQVNWAAKGTNTPEETLKFANALAVAATLAASFKYNGYKVYYED